MIHKNRFTPHHFSRRKSGGGFTLIELLVIIGVIGVLAAVTVPAFHYFETKSELDNSAEKVISILRLAQQKTISSEGGSPWGVYFGTSTSPHQYILFKGDDYVSRATSSDEIYALASAVEFFEIDFGSENEVVFEQLSGATGDEGTVSLRLKIEPSKTKTAYVEPSGRMGLGDTAPASETNRVKDSRHIHFDYARIINTSSEKITLSFDQASPVTKEIVISENLEDGQIFWAGTVDVAGNPQKIEIHTHRLNLPDSQFCLHRDRRYNDKSLKVTISADATGTLIEYSPDGKATKGTSIYANDPIPQ